MSKGSPPFCEVLRAEWSVNNNDLCDLSIAIDWDSLIMLPKHVAIKGDNDLYLSAIPNNNLHYLQFSSNSIEDGKIWMETLTTKDGKVRVKSIFFERLWKRGPSNYIVADTSPNTPESPDTLFSPRKLARNVVALCNLSNKNFVKRFTITGKKSFFNALAKEPDVCSRLEIIELVRLREIHEVKFHLALAKIFGGVSIALANKEATNHTNCFKNVKFSFSYKNEVFSSWSSSITTKLDVKTRLESGIVVTVDGKRIEMLPTKFNGEYKWGETITTSNSSEQIFEVTIPPMHSVVVILNATKASFEVPFSYKQTDTLIGGKKEEYSLEDGVYHGANYYNFGIQTTSKSICGCPN